MLKTTAESLNAEVKSAIAYRAPIMVKANELSKLFSPWRQSDASRALENHPFEFINVLMPSIAFNNPRVAVRSDLPSSQKDFALAHQYALNAWVDMVDFATELEPAAYDFAMSYAVMHVSIASAPGYDGTQEFVPVRPIVTTISPSDFVIDPKAKAANKARFMGHSMVLDREDLARDPRVNAGIVRGLKPPTDESPIGQSAERDDVVIYEVWVPEKTLGRDELPRGWSGPPPSSRTGYHGTIYTFGQDSFEGWVRDPRPFYGPPWGPYHIFGGYTVSGSPLPQSALISVYYQIVENNDIAKSISDSVKRYKRFVVASSDEVASAIQNMPHDNVVAIPGFDPTLAQNYEVGGVTDQMITARTLSKEQLDRNSGLSDSQRGIVTGGSTATENSIAETNNRNKLSWLESRFLKGVTQVLKSVSWYFHYTPEIIFPVPVREGSGEADGLFIGGSSLPDVLAVAKMQGSQALEDMIVAIQEGRVEVPSAESWYNLRIGIEAYSMQFTNSALAQKRAMDMLNLVTQMAPIMPQVQGIDWKLLFEMVGQPLNMPGLSEVIDQAALAAQQQQQQEPTAVRASRGGGRVQQPTRMGESRMLANEIKMAGAV